MNYRHPIHLSFIIVLFQLILVGCQSREHKIDKDTETHIVDLSIIESMPFNGSVSPYDSLWIPYHDIAFDKLDQQLDKEHVKLDSAQLFYLYNRALSKASAKGNSDYEQLWLEDVEALANHRDRNLFGDVLWMFNQAIQSDRAIDVRDQVGRGLKILSDDLKLNDRQIAHEILNVVSMLYINSIDSDFQLSLLLDHNELWKRVQSSSMDQVYRYFLIGGIYHYDFGDYKTAQIHLQEAGDIYDDCCKGNDLNFIAESFLLEMASAANGRDSLSALKASTRAIKTLDSIPEMRQRLLKQIIASITAFPYINLESAIPPLAQKFHSNVLQNEHVLKCDFYRSMGYYYGELKERDSARLSFHLALNHYDTAQALKMEIDDSFYDDALYGLAELELYYGDRNKGFALLEQAAQKYFGAPLKQLMSEEPIINLRHDVELPYFLESWAQYVRTDPEFDLNSTILFQRALDAYHLLDILVKARRDYLLEENVIGTLDDEYRIYSKAIDLVFDRFEQEPSEELAQEAFYFIERNQANLLLSKLTFNQLAARYDLPDQVIETATELFTREKELFVHSNEENRNEKGQLIKEREAFNRRLQVDFPKFYQSLNQDDRVSFDEMKSFANSNDALMIHLHEFRDTGYLFLQTADQSILQKIALDTQIIDSIDRFVSLVSAQPRIGHRNQAGVMDFDRLSHFVYSSIFGSIDPSVLQMPNWYLSANGVFGRIPFDALVVDQKKRKQVNYELKYLGHQVSLYRMMSFTTSIRNDYENQDLSEYPLIAFSFSGPDYEKRQRGMGLPHSYDECNGIVQIWGNDQDRLIHSTDASRNQFIDLSTNKAILHLSIHGIGDETSRFGGQLIFGDLDTLDMLEILSLNMLAPLVVLSACQTGVGMQMKGEGVYHFARPFILAGTDQVLLSRWNLNITSSEFLMQYFYQNLAEGKMPLHALALSKRQFVQRHPKFAHPYYWASLQIVS